jgi:hypothetical protein
MKLFDYLELPTIGNGYSLTIRREERG